MTRRLISTLALALGAATGSWADAGTRPAPDKEVWMTVGDDTLSTMRGGFDLGSGLMVSFGISRMISVNGVLLASTAFNLPDITRVTPAQAEALERYLGSTSVVQVGGNNTAPSQATGGTPATASTTTAAAAPGQPAQSQVTAQGTAQGAVDTMLPATIVQNTLNNQAIQTRTVIDATTNALSLIRSVNTSAALRDALARAMSGR